MSRGRKPIDQLEDAVHNLRADINLLAMRADTESDWPDRLLAAMANHTILPPRPLTAAETQALTLASRGLEAQEAADKSGRTLESIKSSLKVARRKLSARNTKQAIAVAVSRKLIP